MKLLNTIANKANLSIEELELQQKRKDFLFIQKSSIDKAKSDGIREGRQDGEKIGIENGEKIGIEKGEKQAKIEIAKNLLDILDIETISLKTGLSTKEIKEIL